MTHMWAPTRADGPLVRRPPAAPFHLRVRNVEAVACAAQQTSPQPVTLHLGSHIHTVCCVVNTDHDSDHVIESYCTEI